MPDYPLVSIAAINYNNAKFVLETLESIRNQTYPNIQLIVIDDCSTDNSRDLIAQWLKTYKGDYKFIKHDVNMGVCVACNSGVKNADGKYYSAIATDDLMMPEKTEKQVSILEKSTEKTGAVYSDAFVINEDGNLLDGLFTTPHRQFEMMPSGNIYHTLLEANYIPGMSFLFKKVIFDTVGEFDASLVYEDYDMWLRIASKYEIIFSDFVSVKYRMRAGSLVSTIKNWIYSDAKIYLKHADAVLPIPRLMNLAREAYSTDDADTVQIVRKLADKIGNNYMTVACLLWKFRIPIPTGEKILETINENLYSTWYRR
jgi:glycosyltransferase involved in cell wall biosynthesis